MGSVDHDRVNFTQAATLLAVAPPLLELIQYQDRELARRDVLIEELQERLAIMEGENAAERDIRVQAEEDRDRYHREAMRQEGLRPFCRGCEADTNLL